MNRLLPLLPLCLLHGGATAIRNGGDSAPRPKAMRFEGILVVVDANNPSEVTKIKRTVRGVDGLPERTHSVEGPAILVKIASNPAKRRIEIGSFGCQYEVDTKRAYLFGDAARNPERVEEFAFQPPRDSSDLIELFPVPLDEDVREKKIGTEKVHGYLCDVYSIESGEATGKVWRLKAAPDIVLKGAARVGTTIMALHPLVVEFGDTIDESIFVLPKKEKSR